MIWCKQEAYSPREIEAFEVWSGDLPAIPPIGTLITIFEGWGSETVERIFFDIPTQELTIEIRPDYTGAYRAQVEESKRLARGD